MDNFMARDDNQQSDDYVFNTPANGGKSSDFVHRPPLRRGTLMLLLQKAASNVPLWIGKRDESPPQLCGIVPANPGYVCPIGAMVAAPVVSSAGNVSHAGSSTGIGGGAHSRASDDSESDAGENWILAEVTDYDPHNDIYDVDDIDEEQQEHHQLPRTRVLPLPLWRVNPETNASILFPLRHAVLALYPQTTCFYKGLVDKQPSGPHDEYLICFEDGSYPGGYSPPLQVAQRYVVDYVEGV